MNLVGIEQRAALHIQVLACPRITVGHTYFAIRITPISFSPIAGVIADTSMRNSSCKDIGLGLQILCHKTTIRSTNTSNLLGIDESMFLTEFLGSFDDILCRTFTGCIHMAGTKFLTETTGTTRLHHIYHIAKSSIRMMWITALEIASRRTASTIIVHNHRILLGCIEMRRQIITAINGISLRIDEIPVLTFTQLYVLQEFFAQVFNQRMFLLLDVQSI